MAQFLNELIQSLGYVGVFLLMGLFAAEFVMPVAGFLARTGDLSLLGVIAAGTLGSSVGSFVIYYAARLIHRDQLQDVAAKYGRWVGISARSTARAERWFDRNARNSVFLGKLVPGVRSATSLVAGYRRMPPLEYGIFTVIPTAISAGVLASAGYAVGNKYQDLQQTLGDISDIIIAVLVAGLVLYFIYRRYEVRHKAKRP